jgi:hypothetical protein
MRKGMKKVRQTFVVASVICVVCLLLIRLGFEGGTSGIAILTRPDGRTPGNVGIGLEVRGVDPAQMPDLKAHVVIKTLDGTVVHEGTANLPQFSFG